MNTIKGQRLYELIEDSVALVVDVNGTDMICSQLNLMSVLDMRYASCVPSNTSGREFMFRMRADQDIEINEVGQVLLVDDQTQDTFAVSLLNWTKVQPEGVESYTINYKTVPEWAGNQPTPIRAAASDAFCPECLEICGEDELTTFGGMCESCSTGE